MMNIYERSKNTSALKEVIYASDDGRIYFFDLERVTFSRDPIDVGFPLTSAVSVDPYGYPVLYVGQTVAKLSEYTGVIGMRMYNLLNHQMIGFESGLNASAELADGAVHGSALVESNANMLIYGADNGLLYTVDLNTEFDLENAEIELIPQAVAYEYKTNLRNAEQGIVSSVAAYGDYAFFGDLSGCVQCVDMNTLKPVWVFDMGDSMLASVSLACEENGVYLYGGSVLKKGSGQVRLVKLNALTGELVWECMSDIQGEFDSKNAEKGIYPGLMASPLIGEGDIYDLVIFNVNQVNDGQGVGAIVYALDKNTGEEVWSHALDVNSVSSPIAVYEPDGTSYLILGDDHGTLRLMDGFTGSTISTVDLGSAIQSSPAAYGNQVVVGTTGGMVYFVRIE